MDNKTFNEEQLQAINSNSHKILCLAGAGSGKTRCLVERVAKLVADGVDPKSILALTFTNAAATEMRERYEKEHVGETIPEFRTFHAFCYSLLCKDPGIRLALGYNSIPAIISDAEEKEISEMARTTCKIKMSIKELKSSARRNKKDAFTVELYNKAVSRLMKQRNLISFDMLNEEVSLLFDANHPATVKYKNRYIVLLSDEHQDVDSHQMRFLESFTNSDIYACGDTLQNLYSFRGTSNEFIKKMSMDTAWEKIRLHTNYRSTRPICDFANAFSVYGNQSYRIEMDAIRDGDAVVMAESDPPYGDDAISVPDAQYVISRLGALDGTTAILCRTNKEVSEMSDYLKISEIPFMTNSHSSLPNLIECLLSDDFAVRWLASFLPSNKYGEYIRLSTMVSNPDFLWFKQTYGDIFSVKKIINQVDQLRQIAFSLDPTDVKVKEIHKKFHLKNIIFNTEGADDDLFGDEFLHFVSDAMLEVSENGIYVGTIHSVKGLEYDNVFVVNADGQSFKLYSEDNKNLFYVAVTRAKNKLFVLTPPNSELWSTIDADLYEMG